MGVARFPVRRSNLSVRHITFNLGVRISRVFLEKEKTYKNHG